MKRYPDRFQKCIVFNFISRLAIFQFLDDTQRITPILAFISFCLGCLNVPLHLLLLGGAIFRQPCGLLPWLVFTFVEHVVIGVPLIVFFGLISLYLAAQLELYIVAGGLIGIVVLLFLLSFSSWCTVLGCYHQFGREEAYSYDALCQNAGGMGIDSTGSSRRSAHHTGEHSYIPPGHPSHNRNSGTGYRIHQGGYYPPHQSSRQLPPVPRQVLQDPTHDIQQQSEKNPRRTNINSRCVRK